MIAGFRGASRGMTLMELLVVIAIIGVLAALLIPATHGMRVRAMETKAKADRHALRTAILAYHTEYQLWPADSQINPTGPTKSSDLIPLLRSNHPNNTRHQPFWEGDDAIYSENGIEYWITINPQGRYPIGEVNDFDRNMAIWFSTK